MEKAETEVIRRILAGERDMYRVLVERHLPAVRRVSMRITRNSVDAEEVAQEAFLRAYNGLPRFHEKSAFGTWIYRIAVNCALQTVERRSRDPGWNALQIDPEDRESDAACPGYTPEEAILDREASTQREQAMQTLTPMERTAFVLRHMEGQSTGAIAKALQVSESAAKQAVFRAVGKLRRELAPAQQDYPARPVARANPVRESR